MRIEMEALLQERIRLDELQRVARLEHVKAVEDTISTSLRHQERIREQEHQRIHEEIQARARAQKYEFEARMQDEMIADLELKANKKLLETMQSR
jgi:hypothetical protein